MTAPAPDAKWLARIARMLEIAEDPRTDENEAEANRAMAMKLMANKNIEEAVARSYTPDSPQDPMTMISFTVEAPWSAVKAPYFAAMIREFGCQVTTERYTQKSRSSNRTMKVGPADLRVFGRTSVVHRSRMLVVSLDIQCTAGLTAAIADKMFNDKAFNRAYVAGFLTTCAVRLRSIINTETAQMSSDNADRYALVLKSDADKAQAAMDAFYNGEEGMKTSAPKFSSQAGLMIGASDGRRADLGQPGIGEGRVAIGS